MGIGNKLIGSQYQSAIAADLVNGTPGHTQAILHRALSHDLHGQSANDTHIGQLLSDLKRIVLLHDAVDHALFKVIKEITEPLQPVSLCVKGHLLVMGLAIIAQLLQGRQIKLFKLLSGHQNVSQTAHHHITRLIHIPALDGLHHGNALICGHLVPDPAKLLHLIRPPPQVQRQPTQTSLIVQQIVHLHQRMGNKQLICTSAAILSQYLIPMFCAEYPQYQVDPQMMEEGEILKLLRRGSIDIALISAPVALEEYCCIPLCRDYAGMSVPLSDHLSARESLTREDLRGKVVIRENNTSIVSQLAQKYVDQVPDIRYIYQNDQSATYTYAQKSDKMAFYSSLGSQMSLQIEGRRFIPFAKEESVFLTYYLIYRSNAVKGREILDAVQWMRSYFHSYNRKVAALMSEPQPLA